MSAVTSSAAPTTGTPLTDPDLTSLTDPGGDEAASELPGTTARPIPSIGTGVRNGLIRTRTVRSNSFRALLKLREDRGAATAEYVIATMAAVGFAGLLIVILRGDEVRGILTELVRSALSVG